jgi:hypothetical protein
MPMYYFQLQSETHTENSEGSELPDLDAARVYAVQCAREFLAHANTPCPTECLLWMAMAVSCSQCSSLKYSRYH